MQGKHLVAGVQRHYPLIYLACHVDHVTARSTKWRLSSKDSSILSHLDRERPMSPRELAAHLGVVPSTLSATIARLESLGYLASEAVASDRRQRALRLTDRGVEAMMSSREPYVIPSREDGEGSGRGLVTSAQIPRALRRSE